MPAAPHEKKPFASFKEAYDTLRDTAEELRSQDEPDIDTLTTRVLRSVEAYKECETRINAVEKALEGAFARENMKTPEAPSVDSAGSASTAGRKGTAGKTASGKFDESDEDIPF
jgi:exodeoxyribonuclease VII small subunit